MLPRLRSRAGSRATDTAAGAAGGRGVAEGAGGDGDAVWGRDAARSSSRRSSCARRALSCSTFWNICFGVEGMRVVRRKTRTETKTDLLDDVRARVGDGGVGEEIEDYWRVGLGGRG